MIAMSIDLLAEGKYQGKHLRQAEDNPAPKDILFGGEGRPIVTPAAQFRCPNTLRGTKLAGSGCGPLRHIFTARLPNLGWPSRPAAVAVPWPGPECAK